MNVPRLPAGPLVQTNNMEEVGETTKQLYRLCDESENGCNVGGLKGYSSVEYV